MSGTYPAPHFASVTLDTPLTVSGGGTGSSSASTARTNLGAAALAGNSGQTFAVANATATDQAVNLGQLTQFGGGNFQAVGANINSSTTLSNTAYGQIFQVTVSGITVTLPASNGNGGEAIWLYSQFNSGSFTLNCTGSGQFIYAPQANANTNTTSITVNAGEWLCLLSRGGGEFDVVAGSWPNNHQATQPVQMYAPLVVPNATANNEAVNLGQAQADFVTLAANIASLRALTSATTATTCAVASYATAGDQGGGVFVVDPNDTSSGATFTGSITPVAPPAAASLSSAAGGTIAATTYYVKLTYNTAAGQTLPSSESSLAVAADYLLSVASPAAATGVTSYNVYVATSTGAETLQASGIAIGTSWTEPTTGLVTGAALPTASTAGSLLDVTAINTGSIVVNNGVYGANIAAGTIVVAQVGGTGATGYYLTNGVQTVPSEFMTSDNGGTIIVDAAGRRWYRQIADSLLTPEMFGAIGNGTADDTSALNQLADVINASGNAYGIQLGGKTYTTTTGLAFTEQVSIAGFGGASVIKNTNASLAAPVLHLSGNAINYSTLRDFEITSVSGITSNAAHGLQIEGGQGWLVDHVQISNSYHGIYVPASQSGATISNCFVHNNVADGYVIDAGNLNVIGCWAINVGLSGFVFTSNSGGSAGILLQACTAYGPGVNGSSSAVGHGFLFQGNSTNSIIDCFVYDCVASKIPWGSGFWFDTYGKNILVSNPYVEVAGLDASLTVQSTQVGMNISQNNYGVTIANPQVTFCSASGIQLDAGASSVVGGWAVANNVNQTGGAQSAGLLIGVAGAVTGIVVNGFSTIVPTGENDSQPFGINSYTSGNTGIISGCALHGTSSAIQNNGSTMTVGTNYTV